MSAARSSPSSSATEGPVVIKAQLVALYRKALARGVPLDEIEGKVVQYSKTLFGAQTVEQQQDAIREVRLKRRIPLAVRAGAFVLPLAFLAVGMYLVGSAVLPILDYYVGSASQVRANALVAPIPREDLLDVTPLVISQSEGASAQIAAEPRIVNEALDYTNLRNWFQDATLPDLAGTAHASEVSTTYTIDIPKIDVVGAEVTIGGEDLNESLIAYAGTAMPGNLGAPVIFGHSVLRQFYNPSENNPRRYNSIFSYIMTLEVGDRIYVTHEGVKYTYMVQDKTEVMPEDVHILLQDYSAKRLKLVTCTPEGTYLRRGIVTAQLIHE